MRNPHTGEPFDTSTRRSSRRCFDVRVPTPLLSMVHMSGDPELSEVRRRTPGLFLNEVQGYMTEEDKDEARAIALDVIRDYPRRGCPTRAGPRRTLHEMMTCWSARTCPTSTSPMLMEEMEIDGAHSRRVEPSTTRPPGGLPVVVIGCGESGLLGGIRLEEAEIPFTIVERPPGSAAPGGALLPRGPRRRGQRLLLLLLRAQRRTGTELLARPAPAPGATSSRSWIRTALSPRALGDRGLGRHGTTRLPPGRYGPERPTDPKTSPGPGGDLRRWAAEPSTPPRIAGARTPSSVRRSTRPAGTTASISPAAGGHDRRRRQRLPDRPGHRPRGRAPDGLPAHRTVDVPHPKYHAGSGPACGGHCATFRSTGAATASSSSGPDRQGSRGGRSTPTTRTSNAP